MSDLTARPEGADDSTREAWVNWNPEPQVHAFGEEIGRRMVAVALCRVTVREHVGVFDPTAPNACEECADYVRRHLSVGDARLAHAKRPLGPNVIECRR